MIADAIKISILVCFHNSDS